MQTNHLCVLIHIDTKGEVGAPLNRFKPSSKIFYWPLQGGTFLWIFYVFLACICYAIVRVCLYVPCSHLLGKGWPLGYRLWCLTVSLLLFHWYPGSGVVLDCIDSWSLHPYILSYSCKSQYDNVSCARTISLHCIFLELFSFDHLKCYFASAL